jgi:arylsulfatase
MWTGVHAVHTGLWDNTNFAYIDELREDVPTIGHMLRDHGYYTAFKGKWHLSDLPADESALERYGFSDYQQWRDMFGQPLQGEQLDGTVAFETSDWLETKGVELDQPWLLVCSLVNPHDIMFLQTEEGTQVPSEHGITAGIQTHVQGTGWFQRDWGVDLPDNFVDDFEFQPPGVAHYAEYIDLNYGHIPLDRDDLWRRHRNYLVNCMRMADLEFSKVLDTMDRLDLWDETIVLLTSDHGEMNGAHGLRQKGPIPFDEACVVSLTVCAPGGRQGERTEAVGSQLDLAPTLLDLCGVDLEEAQGRYDLKGRSLRSVIEAPQTSGPRGSAAEPGDGALVLWDALHSLDNHWSQSGALAAISIMGYGSFGSDEDRKKLLHEVGERFGAPDFSKRNFIRSVVDGRYKLVRWFSPSEYGNPSSLGDLYAAGDIALYDLTNDPGELDNIAHPEHPKYQPEPVADMLAKLHRLVATEIGDDTAPFSLDLFGTREIKYQVGG